MSRGVFCFSRPLLLCAKSPGKKTHTPQKKAHSQEWLCYRIAGMTYYERNLPHWHPEGRAIFVTWRLYGSLPTYIVEQLRRFGDLSGNNSLELNNFWTREGLGPCG